MVGDGMDPEILNIVPDFTEKIEVPKLAVQIMFDALCASLDFGSGFLDTEEVHALREVAKILGVDPIKATPSSFCDQFEHVFEPIIAAADYRTGTFYPNGFKVDACEYCELSEGHRIHSRSKEEREVRGE